MLRTLLLKIGKKYVRSSLVYFLHLFVENKFEFCSFKWQLCLKVRLSAFCLFKLPAEMQTKAEAWDINIEVFLRNYPLIYNVHVPQFY